MKTLLFCTCLILGLLSCNGNRSNNGLDNTDTTINNDGTMDRNNTAMPDNSAPYGTTMPPDTGNRMLTDTTGTGNNMNR